MKHWKAYIKQPQSDNQTKQYVAMVSAPNEFEAITQFKLEHGQNCIIGWIKETKLDGLQSISN